MQAACRKTKAGAETMSGAMGFGTLLDEWFSTYVLLFQRISEKHEAASNLEKLVSSINKFNESDRFLNAVFFDEIISHPFVRFVIIGGVKYLPRPKNNEGAVIDTALDFIFTDAFRCKIRVLRLNKKNEWVYGGEWMSGSDIKKIETCRIAGSLNMHDLIFR